MTKTSFIFLVLVLIPLNLTSQESRTNNNKAFPVLKGSYLGQKPPNNKAEIFANGIISNGLYTRDIAMMPDGSEIYFCVTALGYNLIFYSKISNGVWTEPEVAPFIKDYEHMYYEPFITADGKKMFFLSNKPKDKTKKHGNEDIWVVDRIGDNWSEPYNLGEPVCSENNEFFPSLTKDGTIYFTRQIKGSRENSIYRSKFVNGKYSEVEKLPNQVNCGTNRFNAFIAPDESYIIVPAVGMPDSYGGANYYIVYRNNDDSWSEPINMGEEINKGIGRAWSPYVSPDGKYFFFMSSKKTIKVEKPTYNMLINSLNVSGNGNADIYWISTDYFKTLKQ